MTLQSAFQKSLFAYGLLRKLGYTRDSIRHMKDNFKAGNVSIELMRKVVTDAGYKCVRSEEWDSAK